ncbi:SDR family NAD(P)-dependent oxidoreductase [Trueperella bialowiezensis]|uniref:SDR family NAD(P)-dependent oxidoreductase n=1 Tax=Trueperella bialowiezensis TaxID=312285 RepID=UPI001F53F4D1|nr:SDR family NAD(P)-dependent oxidoreductase [Trueperella bialowiezensis]
MLKRRVPIAGAVVVVTGGGSGIGRLMAKGAAARGAKAVLVWDLSQDAARAVAEEIGQQARAVCVDVTSNESVAAAAEQALEEFGRVDILINNAGIVTGKDFLSVTEADVERTFAVNTTSHYRTVKAFLPGMLERDRGAIVTIASAAGLVGVARQADYSPSKFGAVGFAQSLRAELRHRGSNVHTLLYCPYYISTGMFEGVKTKFRLVLPIITPDTAARHVLDALEAGCQMKVDPPFVRAAQVAQALPVPVLDKLLDFFGINQTMDDFVGRSSGVDAEPRGADSEPRGADSEPRGADAELAERAVQSREGK